MVALSKGNLGMLLMICLKALLICLLFSSGGRASDAWTIGYEPIRRGDPAGCKDPSCLPPAASPYQRGCSRITRCRGGGTPPVDADAGHHKNDNPQSYITGT